MFLLSSHFKGSVPYGVKYILNNPVYKGYVRFNNYQNWAVERRSGKNDKSKVILVKGKHKSQ